MSTISASAVKELREMSGAGMMDCKKALTEASGNLEDAIDILRKTGIAKARKKSGRSAKEGLVFPYIHPGSKLGVLLEINCETDFVANTDDFKDYVKIFQCILQPPHPWQLPEKKFRQIFWTGKRQYMLIKHVKVESLKISSKK